MLSLPHLDRPGWETLVCSTELSHQRSSGGWGMHASPVIGWRRGREHSHWLAECGGQLAVEDWTIQKVIILEIIIIEL